MWRLGGMCHLHQVLSVACLIAEGCGFDCGRLRSGSSKLLPEPLPVSPSTPPASTHLPHTHTPTHPHIFHDLQLLPEDPLPGKAGGDPGNAFELVYTSVTDVVRSKMQAADPVLAEWIR